jgi:hypothetical protein
MCISSGMACVPLLPMTQPPPWMFSSTGRGPTAGVRGDEHVQVLLSMGGVDVGQVADPFDIGARVAEGLPPQRRRQFALQQRAARGRDALLVVGPEGLAQRAGDDAESAARPPQRPQQAGHRQHVQYQSDASGGVGIGPQGPGRRGEHDPQRRQQSRKLAAGEAEAQVPHGQAVDRPAPRQQGAAGEQHPHEAENERGPGDDGDGHAGLRNGPRRRCGKWRDSFTPAHVDRPANGLGSVDTSAAHQLWTRTRNPGAHQGQGVPARRRAHAGHRHRSKSGPDLRPSPLRQARDVKASSCRTDSLIGRCSPPLLPKHHHHARAAFGMARGCQVH